MKKGESEKMKKFVVKSQTGLDLDIALLASGNQAKKNE